MFAIIVPLLSFMGTVLCSMESLGLHVTLVIPPLLWSIPALLVISVDGYSMVSVAGYHMHIKYLHDSSSFICVDSACVCQRLPDVYKRMYPGLCHFRRSRSVNGHSRRD